MTATTQSESSALAVATRPQFDLSPQTFEQALTFSQYLAESDLVPKDFKGKPGNCLIAMQWGAELGLKPMQAMQNLAIINGRPSLWGDAVIALVRSSPLCEYVIETDDGSTASCKVKRRGDPSEQVRTFSMEDAKAAGLAGKQGPWVQYPKRMRQMRARAFALRDVFPDVLRGLPVAEELMDTPTEKHMGAADVVHPEGSNAPPPPPAKKPYPAADFDVALPTWQKAINRGKTAAGIFAAIAQRSPDLELSAEQRAAIEALKPQNALTYAEVADKIANAATRDALDLAGDLISSVVDPEQRKELNTKWDRRSDELREKGL